MTSMTTKVCNRCQVKKQKFEFSKRTKSLDGLQAYCKDCSKTYLSNWQDEKRDRYNKYMRDRYRKNEGHRIAHLNRQRVYQAMKRHKNTRSPSLMGIKVQLLSKLVQLSHLLVQHLGSL